MDYINLPRSLIYKERTNLKEFGVQVHGTINSQLFSNLKELFMGADGAIELMLDCFNNAYYICTLIPFDEFPELEVVKYEKLLLNRLKTNPNNNYICAISMAIVSKLMPASDTKWKQENSDLVKSINTRFTNYQWIGTEESKSFIRIAGDNNTDGLTISPLEFAPRDIIEAIDYVDARVLAMGKEYICEKLALLDDPKQRTYGADLAIAHLNDELRDTYQDYGYHPETNSFEPAEYGTFGAEPDFVDSFWEDVNPIKEAIEYIERHRQVETNGSNEHAAKTENEASVSNYRELESIRASYEELLKRANIANEQQADKIKKLEGNVCRLQEELRQAQGKIKEFMMPVEELTAEQKVRMAFALNLLKAAGLTDEMLGKNKSKVANLIHLLTGIGVNNNGKYPPAQICKNWLVGKQYYPERNSKNIIEINTLCANLQLNTKAFLILSAQSNTQSEDKMRHCVSCLL